MRFNYGTIQFLDYPKLGVWAPTRITSPSTSSITAGRSPVPSCVPTTARSMLAGAAATQQCFQLSNSFQRRAPRRFSTARMAPPSGAPAPFINFGSKLAQPVGDSMLTGPLSRTPRSRGPSTCRWPPLRRPCGGGTCIAQPGTSTQLDSLADRLMYRFAYRNGTSASAAETAVVNHSVKVSG